MFDHSKKAELGRIGLSGSYNRITYANYAFDISKFNTVTILIFEDQIATFANSILVYETNTAEETVYKEHILGANNDAICEFDNFKLWDLTGIAP